MTFCNRRHLLASTVISSMFIAAPVMAQTANAPATGAEPVAEASADQTIIVTGSRIARTDLLSSSPVAIISSDTLKATNSVTIESYLSQSPQFVAANTSTTNNGSDGTASVDLRGLGSQRTLVLIDGKRMVPANIGGAVDINAIPAILVKRIEVLTGGASSVYGADAVAGVVNFVLDEKFTGLNVDGSTQVTDKGDAGEQNVSIAAGIKLGERGHFIVAGDFTHREGVYQSARGYSAVNTNSSSAGSGPGGQAPSGSSNAVPTVIDISAGRFQLNDGSQPGAVNDFVDYYKPYNFNPANYLQVPFQRLSATALFNYEVTDNIEFFARGSYTNSKVTDTLAPTATAGYNFVISPDNPFLTPQQQNLIFSDPNNLNADGTANVGIRRRAIETGGRVEKYNSDVYFGIGGLRGDVGTFHYEVFAQYGVTKTTANHLNDLSYNAVSQAVNAVPGPNGPVCADPTGGCVPLNLFTTNAIPANQLAFVLRDAAQSNKYTQFVTGASLSGDLSFLKSPLAEKPAAVSVGVEYRSETGNQLVDANYGSGDLIYYGQGTNVPTAAFNAKEAFGELRLPLVSDKPFFEELNVEGGIRYSHYKNRTSVGENTYNATTYKFGGDWTPVTGLRIRALFNRAIRDPNLSELNAPVTSGTDNLATDICAGPDADHPGVPAQPTAAQQAICIAQGAPANSFANGGDLIKQPISGQVNALSGGNPLLKPEKANTWTAGVVLSPRMVHGLNITADYYSITIKDYINTNGGSIDNLSDQCYNQGNSAYCQAFIRNTFNGQLSGGIQFGVLESLANTSQLKTRGVDVSVNYSIGLGGDRKLLLDYAGNYTIQYDLTPAAGLAPIKCAGLFGFACNLNPIPKYKHTFNATLDVGGLSWLVRWRLIGQVKQDAGTDILLSKIPSYSYIDSTIAYRLKEGLSVHVGVNNLFDVDPPIVGGTAGGTAYNSGNTFPQVYDALGRTFFAGVSVKF